MSTAQSTQTHQPPGVGIHTANLSASTQPLQSGNPRNSRSNANRPSRRARSSNTTLSFRPASIVPGSVTGPTNPQQTDQPSARNGHQNGRSRGRGTARATDIRRTVNGRQFSGQLTRGSVGESANSDAQHQLHAAAQTFVPSQQPAIESKTKPAARPKQPRHPKEKTPKSHAADIATRTHEDIDRGHYECPICVNEVQRNSKVWSCHDCWTVFHLTCIKKWATNEGSAAQRNVEGSELPSSRQWRCPGCNLPKNEAPKNYSCWCGKEDEPRPLPGLPPHSCGNSCGRERRCPHPCQLTCHAGPCPLCPYNGPTQVCHCGKHESTKRCAETNYDTGWACGDTCGAILSCGEHRCQRLCHSGPCLPCDALISARCYCGCTEKAIKCHDRGEPKLSQLTYTTDAGEDKTTEWTGIFDCGTVCHRLFDCGVHACSTTCHAQNLLPAHCPKSPDVVTHCPCGKTPLSKISTQRTSCTDSVPHCQQPCGRMRACGHPDTEICHSGECKPCTQKTDIKCRCGRTTSRTMCHQGSESPPQCSRPCKTTLNCGRHACDERCCPGDRKAVERLINKRKHRPLHTGPRRVDDDFEAEHICTRQCGRLLTCSNHECQDLCHKGPCVACREAIFEEVSCSCGRTLLQPPLPCGTKPPPCRFPCVRDKSCGHPRVAHNCHDNEESCPKCPFLVEKRCLCGKKMLKNQQCWLQDVRCGEICGLKLRCGAHTCRKTCHRPGDCEDANRKPCVQPCGKEKSCGHPDLENPCHAPFRCKEDSLCQSKIYITCACQAQRQESKCGASSRNPIGNREKTLPCNDECARLERNRKLALALDIDQSTHVDGGDHIPYSTETLNLFAAHSAWAQAQEREFRVFASSEGERRMRFKPMQSYQRSFIHALAEDFGFDSESMDPEPHRHVMIWKTPRFVSAPNKTLADSLRLRGQRTTALSTTVSTSEPLTKPRPVSIGPYNAFVISNPRFGLTIDELDTVVNEETNLPLTFDIHFLRSSEVILKPDKTPQSAHELQKMLEEVSSRLAQAVALKGFGALKLCAVDDNFNITRREETDSATQNGWSKVAAKKSVPKTAITPAASLAGSNAFASLGSNKVTFAKKKPNSAPKVELVPDDWEAAELAEEIEDNKPSDMIGSAVDDVSTDPTKL